MQLSIPEIPLLTQLSWLLFTLAAASFAYRIVTRVKYPYGRAGDTLFHLMCGKIIRETGKKPETIDGFVWNNTYTYPPLYHQFLALVPVKYHGHLESFSSVIFDLLQWLAIFTTVYLLFEQSPGSHRTFEFALLVASANTLSPVFNTQIWGPRVMNGTARPMGETMFVVGSCAIVMYMADGQYLWLIPAALFFGFMPLASKFATQVLVFLIPVCLYTDSLPLLWSIVFGVGFAAIITKGHLLKVIQGQILHSVFYLTFLQKHYYTLHNKTVFSLKTYLWRAMSALYNAPRSFSHFYNWLFFDPSFYHIILFYNFHLWSLGAVLLFSPQTMQAVQASAVESQLMIFAFAPLLPVFITSLRKVRFLGESYRYLEYSQWAIWLLLAIVSPYALVAVSVLYALACFIFLRRAKDIIAHLQERYQNTEAFFNALRDAVGNGRCFPMDGVYYETRTRGDVEVLGWPGNMRNGVIPKEDMKIIFGRFPFPAEGGAFVDILRKYDATHILCHKTALGIIGTDFESKVQQVPMPESDFVLYSLKNQDD